MTINPIYIVLRVAAICIVFAYLVFTALESRYRYSKSKTRVLVFLLVMITVIISILFLTNGLFLYKYSTWGILLWLISAIIIFSIAIKGSYLEILFVVLVVLNLYVNIMAIAKIIIGILSPEHFSSVLYSAVSIVVLILYIPLLWVLFCKFYKKVVEFNIYLFFWKYMWSIPALCYLIFYVKIIDDYWKQATLPDTHDLAYIILWSLVTYILFCGTLLMLIQAYNGITAEEKKRLAASQLRIQEQQYKKLLENMDKTARIRHDWRHHLLTISGLAEKEAAEEVKSYIQDLFPQYISNHGVAFCENHVVDIVLRHYFSIAEADKIELDISVDIPDDSHITDIDLCVIFGNLTENAIEACRSLDASSRYIEINSCTMGEKFAITMKNTYQNKLLLKDGNYFSTKHEGTGIGLPSVKRIAEKYGGIVKIKYDNDYFYVNLIV